MSNPQLNIINKDSYVKGKHKDTGFDDFFDMKYRFAYLVVGECLSVNLYISVPGIRFHSDHILKIPHSVWGKARRIYRCALEWKEYSYLIYMSNG